MARFNLDDYIDVAERIEQFYEKYPDGRIITDLMNVGGWNGKQTQFIVLSMVYDGQTLLATGLAEESFGNSGPNQTSALENAETSSIGRAIANLGFHTTRSGARQRPSRQEMEKVQRGPSSPVDEMRKALGKKFETSEERKKFVEGVVERELASLNDLSEAEIAGVLLAL